MKSDELRTVFDGIAAVHEAYVVGEEAIARQQAEHAHLNGAGLIALAEKTQTELAACTDALLALDPASCPFMEEVPPDSENVTTRTFKVPDIGRVTVSRSISRGYARYSGYFDPETGSDLNLDDEGNELGRIFDESMAPPQDGEELRGEVALLVDGHESLREICRLLGVEIAAPTS
jgi:hypothetical protein